MKSQILCRANLTDLPDEIIRLTSTWLSPLEEIKFRSTSKVIQDLIPDKSKTFKIAYNFVKKEVFFALYYDGHSWDDPHYEKKFVVSFIKDNQGDLLLVSEKLYDKMIKNKFHFKKRTYRRYFYWNYDESMLSQIRVAEAMKQTTGTFRFQIKSGNYIYSSNFATYLEKMIDYLSDKVPVKNLL